jgi:hypothetical protein
MDSAREHKSAFNEAISFIVPCDGSSTEAKPDNFVEGFYRRSHERPGRRGLVHRGGAELAGLGNLLCAVFRSPGKPPHQRDGYHQTSDQEWMEQIARSATQETWGYLHSCRYVLHDRDTKFYASFQSMLAVGGVKAIPLPARKPESECLCGTLGPLCQAGVLVEVDPVRRAPSIEGLGRIQQSLAPYPNSAAAPLSVATGSEAY